MTRLALIIALMLFAAASVASADMSMDVTPLRIRVLVDPGEEYTNAVQVTNSGEEPLRLRAYLEDWYLDEVGTPVFRPAGSLNRTASFWVETAPSDLLLRPGETEYVRFTVRVPEGMEEGGFHTSLLLESLPVNRAEKGGRQVFVQGRVACMVYVTVGNPHRSAEITDLASEDREGKRWIRLRVANTGEDFIRLAGDLNILAGRTNLGEPIQVPDVPVLPGAARWVEIEIPADQFAENATARVTIELDGIGTLVGETPLQMAGHRAQ
jgi:hypothetical protein